MGRHCEQVMGGTPGGPAHSCREQSPTRGRSATWFLEEAQDRKQLGVKAKEKQVLCSGRKGPDKKAKVLPVTCGRCVLSLPSTL